MTKLIASLVLAASVLTGIASANAAPDFGNALRDAARMSGQITPHGVFDAF